MEFETYDGESVIVDEFHYSTEEQWTGKYWIDGSKIYTITFSVPKFSNAKINVNSGTKNIKVLTDVKGSFERDGYNFCYTIDNMYLDETRLYKDTGKLEIATNNSWVTLSGYVTLEYTKTTG